MSGYVDDAREELNEWAESIDAETFSKQYEALTSEESFINKSNNSITKNISVTVSVSVKSLRVPVDMYEDMLLSDDEILSKIDGELYLGKYLVIADESLDEIDIDFECNMVDNDE